ncbi:stonustoxin subunit alpha-like [Pygocentrus nattereri]|uniref:stonustoxin subunit alpha-like n=1 Tax=Pygocentrus nattereri TaxID=42514 RepID=UPI001890CEDE|nr:stonustoxin subunit alpha-like [Pygocentrus nattereri]
MAVKHSNSLKFSCSNSVSELHAVFLFILDSCNLEEKSCEILGSVLQLVNSSLKDLDLSKNDLQDSGTKLLSTGLKSRHCKLEILRLSGCMITEEGCSALTSALSSNPSHLKELDLTYNHPGDTGVKLLSARLEDPHCRLETLRVDYGGEVRMKPGLKKYSCDVTLDPNTANTRLSLSEENRKVVNVEESQSYPDHPERFDVWDQFLCRETLTGRCYWEAQWSGDVYIAVTYKGIRRKGISYECRLGWNENSWILSCSNIRFSVWHNKIITAVSAPFSQSNRVGVYLDCPAGSLSFYSVSTETHRLTHLHTFSCSFTEPLYAGFGLYSTGSSVCVR